MSDLIRVPGPSSPLEGRSAKVIAVIAIGILVAIVKPWATITPGPAAPRASPSASLARGLPAIVPCHPELQPGGVRALRADAQLGAVAGRLPGLVRIRHPHRHRHCRPPAAPRPVHFVAAGRADPPSHPGRLARRTLRAGAAIRRPPSPSGRPRSAFRRAATCPSLASTRPSGTRSPRSPDANRPERPGNRRCDGPAALPVARPFHGRRDRRGQWTRPEGELAPGQLRLPAAVRARCDLAT